jgi:hypothetical protein
VEAGKGQLRLPGSGQPAAGSAAARTGAAAARPATAGRAKTACRNMSSMMSRPPAAGQRFSGRYPAAGICSTGRHPAPASCMRLSEARPEITRIPARNSRPSPETPRKPAERPENLSSALIDGSLLPL